MAYPTVTALIYQVVHDAGVAYSPGAQLKVETPDFTVHVENDRAMFVLKHLFDEVRAARKVVEPFALAWAADAAIERGPGEFVLTFKEAIFDGPPPFKGNVEPSLGRGVGRAGYPSPPDGTSSSALGEFMRSYPRVRASATVALQGVSARGEVGSLSVSGATVIEPPSGQLTVTPHVVDVRIDPPFKTLPTFHLPNDWETEKHELTARLDALESALRDALPLVRAADELRTGIGGNHPPEPIDGEAGELGGTSDIVIALRTIGDLRAQFTLPEPDDHPLTLISAWALKKSVTAILATLRWIGGLGNEAAKAAAKAAGVAAVGALLAGPANTATVAAHISQDLHAVIDGIMKLI